MYGGSSSYRHRHFVDQAALSSFESGRCEYRPYLEISGAIERNRCQRKEGSTNAYHFSGQWNLELREDRFCSGLLAWVSRCHQSDRCKIPSGKEPGSEISWSRSNHQAMGARGWAAAVRSVGVSRRTGKGGMLECRL